MSQLIPPHLEKPEVSGSVRHSSVAGKRLPQKCWNKVSISHPDHCRPPARLNAFCFQCVRKCFSAGSLKSGPASLIRRTAPAQCQSAPTSSPDAFPPSPSRTSGMQDFHTTSSAASENEIINVNELYSRLMLNCGLRVAGAMAVTAVPAFLLFKRPSLRTFLIGAVGGLVSGWQLYKADLIIRNPRENAALVPKATSIAECADEIQREWAETAKRLTRFDCKKKT